VAFDIVVNNADRKSGHVLVAEDGHLWAIDHGLTFHSVPKVRTVIWEYAGKPVPDDILVDLSEMTDGLADPESDLNRDLHDLLAPAEVKAIEERVHELLDVGEFPEPDPERREYPWPPV
jgi:uncharacterized repeat protein (TIGR03843 family)